MKSFENLREMLDAQRAKTQQSIDYFNKAVFPPEPVPHDGQRVLTGAEVARARVTD